MQRTSRKAAAAAVNAAPKQQRRSVSKKAVETNGVVSNGVVSNGVHVNGVTDAANVAVVEPVKQRKPRSTSKTQQQSQSVKQVEVTQAAAPVKQPRQRKPKAQPAMPTVQVQQPEAQQPPKSRARKAKIAAVPEPTPEPQAAPVEEKKASKPRQPNQKPTNMVSYGISIGPARVNKALIRSVLNPTEYAAIHAIKVAAGKPATKPKPTAENPDPQMLPAVPARPVNTIDPAFWAVVQDAESKYEDLLTESYEREVISKFDEATRENYHKQRKEATKSESFDQYTFNATFKKDFYDGLDAYIDQNDSCKDLVDEKGFVVDDNGKRKVDINGKEYQSKSNNEWSRAQKVIHKVLTLRVSAGTRIILATFLDTLVEQYIRNGLHNCKQAGYSIMHVDHALARTEGYKQRMPLDKLVMTYDCYDKADTWLAQCEAAHERHNKAKKEGKESKLEEPEYPHVQPKFMFMSYVQDLCRYVKNCLIKEQTTTEEKEKCARLNFGLDFKQFCVDVIVETIERVGKGLKLAVENHNVKTVSDKLVFDTLKSALVFCGLDYAETINTVQSKIKRYRDIKDANKALRDQQAANTANNAAKPAAEQASVDHNDVEEVEDVEAVEDDNDEEDGAVPYDDE